MNLSKFKATLGACLTAALAAALVATSGQALSDVARDRTLIIGTGSDGPTFRRIGAANPYAFGSNLRIGFEYVYEPLFYFNFFENKLIPWLASGYEFQDDNKTVIINLRDGVTWNDGVPFTADDVVFTLQMLIDNGKGEKSLKHAVNTANRVADATAIDSLTVRIDLVNPDPRYIHNQLAAYLGFGLFWLPKHIWEDVDDVASFTNMDQEAEWPIVGTGAWTLEAATQQSVSLVRSGNWWGAASGFRDLPEVERIVLTPVVTPDTAGQLAANDELDWFPGAPDVNLVREWLRQNENLVTFSGREPPYGHVDWWPHSLYFNNLDPQWEDRRVRRAIAHAINREQLVEVGLGGENPLSLTPYPATEPLAQFIEIAEKVAVDQGLATHDLDKSASLMEEAGYARDSEGFWAKDGQRINAEMQSVPYLRPIGPLVVEQLKRGGFDASYLQTPDSRRLITEGRTPLVLHGHNGSIFDPVATLEMYTSSAVRPVGVPTFALARWSDADLDAIVAEMVTIPPGAPELVPLFEKAIELWYAGVPEIPLQQEIKRAPMNSTYWINWPSQENPYIDPFPSHFGLSNTLVAHELKAAQ
jgi:peptide/nickel transport system substrate-binding protein